MIRLIFLLSLLFASSAQAITWESSCGSKYKKTFLKNEYIFTVRLGERGGCKSDKIRQEYSSASWDWSERSEVRSNAITPGKYTWTADIEIIRNCRPAYRNTLFQVHGNGYLKNPPSWIGISSYNKFKTNQAIGHTHVDVPDKFNLRAEVDYSKDKRTILVDYFVDGRKIVSSQDYGGPWEQVYFKFGSYRVNANCDITQIYRNVKVTKKG